MELTDMLFYLAGVLLAWVVFYNVVKAAVRNGIREARKDFEIVPKKTPDRAPNEKQALLQQRYDKGEITFEAYKAEWEKLS